jgi:archaellum biogenesis ATPase FlaH
MTFQSINRIQTTVVKRIPAGLDEIDWLYGITKSSWGIPEGAISLWAGQAGIGKSRLAVEVARLVSSRGFCVLYFQNETTKSNFANCVKADGQQMPPHFYISDATRLSDQLQDIRSSRAQLVIIDSINMLEDFKFGSDKNIKRIIEGYRTVCQETNCHVILLSQLTKDGLARGSSTLTHLVDIVFLLKQGMNSSQFIFRVGDKHRYGRTGDNYWSYWLHLDNRVCCFSDYSRDDKLWCQTHNINWVDRLAVAKAEWDQEQAEFDKKEAKEMRKFERSLVRQSITNGVIRGVGNVLTVVGAGLAALMTYEAFRGKGKK